MTLSGTASDIDTYLNTASNIQYTGALNANGNNATTLTLTANDGGNTGSGGGGNVALGTVSVNITPVNDRPVLDDSKSPELTTIIEDLGNPVNGSTANSTLVSDLIDNGGVLNNYSDVEGDLPGIAITAVSQGTLWFTTDGGTNWAFIGAVDATSALVLNADANTRVYFKPNSNVSGLVSNAVTIKAWDRTSGNNGNTGRNTTIGTAFSTLTDDVSVSITAVNDPPTLTATGQDPTYVEGAVASDLYSGLTVSTVESGQTLTELRLTVTNVSDGASEILNVDGSDVALTDGNSVSPTATNGMTVSVGVTASTATVTITKVAGINEAAAQTLIDGLTYRNSSDNPTTGSNRVVIITYVKDNGGTLNGGDDENALSISSTVSLTPVNDPPVVTGVFGDSNEIVAGAGAQNISLLDDATVSNADSPDYNGGFLTIAQSSGTANGNFGVDGTTVSSGGDGTIAAGETIAIGGTSIGTVNDPDAGQSGGILQIDFDNANATNDRIQTLLRSFTYSAPSGLGARVFTLTLNDGDGTVSGGDDDASGSFTINITPNPPVITNLDGDNPTIPVGGTAGNIDVDGDVIVTDYDSGNFNGGNLSIVQNSGISNGNFSLSGTGSTGVASGTSTLDADGTISGSEIIFVDGIAIASVSAANNGQSGNDLQFNFGSNATPASVQVVLRDLKYSATTGVGDRTFTISITDASVSSATGTADITITIAPPEMDLKQGTSVITDGNSYDFGNRVINSSIDVIFTIENNGPGELTITTPLTLAGADAAEFSIQQQPSSQVASSGTTTFTVRFTPTSPGAKTAAIAIANNDDDENPYDITLTGSGNSQPSGSDKTITMNEDEIYSFSSADFSFNDPDGDGFAGIQLQSSVTKGRLIYDSLDAITNVDYPDPSKFIFIPDSNDFGSPYTDFTFKVKDNNGTYSISYKITIIVDSVDDVPVVIINNGINVAEGDTAYITADQLKAEDVDGDTDSLLYKITQPPLFGIIAASNGNDNLGSFSQLDLTGGNVMYIHGENEAEVDSFKFNVEDPQGNTSEEEVFYITIENVNDPPVITSIPDLIMTEDITLELNIASLYQYVEDPDNPDSTLSFNFTSGLHVSINQTSNVAWNIIPEENYFGSTGITLVVDDGIESDTAKIGVTVEPVNDIPELTGIPDSVALASGESESFTINYYDIETDKDSLTINYTYPEGINVEYDSLSGTFTINAIEGFLGDYLLSVSVSDPDGGVAEAEIPVWVTDEITGIKKLDEIPTVFDLSQNYPNPFNPATKIRFGLPEAGEVILTIYNILGQQLIELVNGYYAPGTYEVNFDGAEFTSGLYIYMLDIKGKFSSTKKMLLVK